MLTSISCESVAIGDPTKVRGLIELAQWWWHYEPMALAHLGVPTQLLSELSFTLAKFHFVREARRWFETHSSSHLSDALEAVGV